MKTIMQKIMGVLTIAITLASCAKKDNIPTPEGTDECWYSITLDDEIINDFSLAIATKSALLQPFSPSGLTIA